MKKFIENFSREKTNLNKEATDKDKNGVRLNDLTLSLKINFYMPMKRAT